jgi:hypothetical protein
MVELWTWKREVKGHGGKHLAKLEHDSITYLSQLAVHVTAGKSSNLAGNHTNTWSSRPNQVSHTPDISYSLVSSISSPASSPIGLSYPQLWHRWCTQSYLSPFYLSMPWSWVITKYRIYIIQYPPSTVYTEYSIRQRQYSQSTLTHQALLYTKFSTHQGNHAQCTAYAKYSIHRVQLPPKHIWLPFIRMITI